MVKYTMNQLRYDKGCNKRRAFTYDAKDKRGENYYKSVAIKKAVKAIVSGVSKEEAIEIMGKVFDDIPYQTTQREILKKDAERYIKRYFDWETREILEAEADTVQVSPELEVEVTPDFIVGDATPQTVTVIEEQFDKEKCRWKKTTKTVDIDGTIEVFRLQAGKQSNFAKIDDFQNDIALYAMLVYARRFVADGKRILIKANYYFLKREDDSFSKGVFKPFDEKQIYGISEIYDGSKNETDERFSNIIETYLKGHDEFDCDPKDCQSCTLYDVCKGYAEAPLPVEREVRTKADTICLNDLQQYITEI